MADLFPSVVKSADATASWKTTVEEAGALELSRSVVEVFDLSRCDAFCRKVVELHGAIKAQCGAVIIGPPGAGKTTVRRCCAEVESRKLAEAFVPESPRN